MRERFREAPRALFEVSGDAFGYRFRSKRGPWEGTITPKTDKAVKKTSDGERTTIIFGKFKNVDALRSSKEEHLLMAKIFPIRFSISSHDKDSASSLLKIFS